MDRIRGAELICLSLMASFGIKGATVSVASSANPATFGAPVTLTANVNPISATGKVTFYDGNSVLGSAALAGGAAILHVNFTATGARSLFARYLGDGSNAAAVSPRIAVSVATNPAYGFTTPTSLSMGIDTQTLAVGDFNNDGKLDILAVGDGNIVSVAPGNGNGTFRTTVTTGLPISSNSFTTVTVADLNLDGNLDIILPDVQSGNLVVAFGNGAGGFTGTSTVNTIPGQVIATDLNGDGIPDIAVLHPGSNSVGVLLGTGTGSFTLLNEYPFAPNLSNMITGDVNGDGKVDLITIVPPKEDDNREVIVLLGDGAGGFSAPLDGLAFQFFYNPTDYYQLQDLNGDGKADLVIVPGYSYHAGVALGNGDGTFQAPVFYQMDQGLYTGGNTGIAVVDITGDGVPDVLSQVNVSNGGPLSYFNLYAGIGDGTLQPLGVSSQQFGYLDQWGPTPALALADFNGDGRIDIATVSSLGHTSVNIYMGSQLPLLQAALSSSGLFTPGQNGATFTITVSNLAGAGPTTGTVTLANSLGLGLTFVSMAGDGWSCNSSSCTRSDPIPGGSNYPPITLTVNVQSTQSLPLVNDQVMVSGGGSSVTSVFTEFVALQVTQAPPAPGLLYPGNGATGIPMTASATWELATGLTGADSYDVYFGTSSPPPFVLNTTTNQYRPALSGGTTYYWQVVGKNTAGSTASPIWSFTTAASVPRTASRAGIFRSSAYMTALDSNGNLAWDPGVDRALFFGSPGDVLIFGDWDGSGTTKGGIFRPSVAMFALDMNGNGVWDPGIDRYGFFGQTGDQPLVGDWTGDGKSKIGIYRPSTSLFALDVNNNLSWDPGTDIAGKFGQPGDVPIVGNWTGDGKYKVGIFRNGFWALDSNGNLAWDSGIDANGTIGQPGDVPLLGDWNGDGRTKVGIYRPSNSLFGLDYNGNLIWDQGVDLGGIYGIPGDTPIVGDWSGTGVTRVGIFRSSYAFWALDVNGNLAWDPGTDTAGGFGQVGDTPVVGKW